MDQDVLMRPNDFAVFVLSHMEVPEDVHTKKDPQHLNIEISLDIVFGSFKKFVFMNHIEVETDIEGYVKKAY